MNFLSQVFRNHTQSWTQAWNAFWFRPSRPETLCLLRIAIGWMLFYCHIIWALQLTNFLGDNAWVSNEMIQHLHRLDSAWSYLWFISNPALLWCHHLLMLILALMVMLGVWTRFVTPLAWFMQLMYVHRLTGTLFGFDQILTILLMYLMIAPSGARWSLDAWRRSKLSRDGSNALTRRQRFVYPGQAPSTAVTIATRLIQVHLCVIYLFGGISKMRGEMWWDGTAMWFAVANFEYQSLDLTWLAKYPILFSALSNLTIFWEAFYPVLIWPRLTRPWVIAMAFAVHGGIALALGMITFGTIMIVANCAFISSDWIAQLGEHHKIK